MTTHIFGKSSLEHAILKSVDTLKEENRILAFDSDIDSFDARNKIITNVSNPRSASDAINRKYFSANTLTLSQAHTEFDAKKKVISNLGDPQLDRDAVNKKFLNDNTLMKNKQNEFDARMLIVSNVRDPEGDLDAVNKLFLKRYVYDAIRDIFSKDLNVCNHKIINCLMPTEDGDVVNKKYLHLKLTMNHSITLLTLNGLDENGYFFISPYGQPHFLIPFDCSIKLSWANFTESDAVVYKNDHILENFFDKNFHKFKKGHQLAIKSKKKIVKDIFYMEIITNCFV